MNQMVKILKYGFFVLTLLIFSLPAYAQIPVGNWRDHYSYNHAVSVLETPGRIYCNTVGGLFYLNTTDQSVHKFSATDGLSDMGICVMAYNTQLNTLILIYENSNIDLITNDQIKNVNDIYRKTITGNKKINAITIIGTYAYLSTSFGVVVMNIEKKEIKDTYHISEDGLPLEIYDFAQFGSSFYAATNKGIYTADNNNPNLAYYGSWEKIADTSVNEKTFNHLAVAGNYLLANLVDGTAQQDSIYVFNNTTWTLFNTYPGLTTNNIRVSHDQLLVSSGIRLSIYDMQLNPTNVIDDQHIQNPKIMDAIIDEEGILRIANFEGGLFSSADYTSFSSIYPNGPYTNEAFSISAWKGHVAVAGGGRDDAWNNIFRNGLLYLFSKERWHSIINMNISDIVSTIPDPANDEKIYAATWGYGILVYEGNQQVKTWDQTNSSLQSIIPGSDFVRIGGMAFDSQHRLWVTNSGVNQTISVKTDDNTWTGLPYGPKMNAPTVGQILITQNGLKWVQLPRGYGLFIFDDHDTPADINDDSSKKISVIDQDGKSHNDVYCLTEDQSGFVWVGTSLGPVVYFNPDQILAEESVRAQQVLVPRNDGSGLADYLLATQQINTIAVDGADRKWMGTDKAGAFLLSPDGTNKIAHFTSENSPLPSNRIYSIAIEPNSGEVFFATDKGVISYRGTATSPKKDLSSVYAFPNPVRPDWKGKVTITGLSEGVTLKITDISGNLIYTTRALGGQAFWDRKNMDGREVNTGIYLVFITDDEGRQTQIIKILVVK